MQLPNECDFAAYNHKLEPPNGERKVDKEYNPKPSTTAKKWAEIGTGWGQTATEVISCFRCRCGLRDKHPVPFTGTMNHRIYAKLELKYLLHCNQLSGTQSYSWIFSILSYSSIQYWQYTSLLLSFNFKKVGVQHIESILCTAVSPTKWSNVRSTKLNPEH